MARIRILPGWVDLFGGRQSARTMHFIVAWLLVAFVAVHVFEVIISGLWNNLRSMITGRYRVKPEARHEIKPMSVATRRRRCSRALAGAGALVLAGCERLSRDASGFRSVLGAGETAELRACSDAARTRKAMAQEFTEADLSPYFRSNGTSMPDSRRVPGAGSTNGFAD